MKSDAVIYARYSTHSQGEGSIEGQLHFCREFAGRNGYNIVGEYIDRAMTAKNDDRPNFLRMIQDSKARRFQVVLVYQFDRFARNRYDSAMYKKQLKDNHVRVISANEVIPDAAMGVFMEGVLEARDEAYSLELAEKVERGQREVAEKRQFGGGAVPLGFKIVDKHYTVNEDTALIVQKAFELYANNSTVQQIIDHFNALGYKTGSGNRFNKNSLLVMLSNRRYVGTYMYKGVEVPNGIPRIIEDDLFNRVTEKLAKNKLAPARARAKEEYLLTTKVFCGHCHGPMVGVSGKSRSGKKHCYYSCNATRKKACDKKNVARNWLEDLVIEQIRGVLNDKNIAKLSRDLAREYEKQADPSVLKGLQREIKEKDKAIDNLLCAIEQGQAVDIIAAQLAKREEEKNSIQRQIVREKAARNALSAEEIQKFFLYLKDGDFDDVRHRCMLVTVMINKIYLFDDKVTIFLNAGDKPEEVTVLSFDDVKRKSDELGCSYKDKNSPPLVAKCAHCKNRLSEMIVGFWRSLPCSSYSAKGLARAACSVASALAYGFGSLPPFCG